MNRTLGGRAALRIAVAVGAAVALAGVVPSILDGGDAAGTSVARPGAGQVHAAFRTATITCPDGATNSGSPDHAPGGTTHLSPLVQAGAWARDGFADRFPAAPPSAADYADGTLVLFREEDGDRLLRAVLLYARTGSEWTLTELTSC